MQQRYGGQPLGLPVFEAEKILRSHFELAGSRNDNQVPLLAASQLEKAIADVIREAAAADDHQSARDTLVLRFPTWCGNARRTCLRLAVCQCRQDRQTNGSQRSSQRLPHANRRENKAINRKGDPVPRAKNAWHGYLRNFEEDEHPVQNLTGRTDPYKLGESDRGRRMYGPP